MSNPAHDLDGPDAPEWIAKQAIVTLLRDDPWLAGRLRFLLSYDGQVLDDADPDDIPRPFLRVTVRPGASGWFAAGMSRFPVQFQVEMAVDGTKDSNLLKLWHHVRIALSPRLMAPGGNLTVLQVMQAGGCATWKFSRAMYEIVDSGKGTLRYIYGLGYVEADLLVNT